MSSKPTTRLGSIFQDASTASSSDQGNASLRYVPPKEPTRAQASVTTAAPTAAASAATADKASSIVYTATVSLYQYDTATRSYVQILNANSSATIGCVIVGSDASYNLLFYNAAKQHVCLVPLTIAAFKPVLQPKNYVSFYDDKSVNWSIKFASEQHVSDFMRIVFLTKIHVEIWGDDKTKSVTKTQPNALIKDDLVAVKDDAAAVSTGDAVAVAFSCWRVVGNVTCAPSDVITKYAPFERATESDLRKFRLGDGSERIKALDEAVVGMRKGGKRIVLAPPGKTNGQDWYLLEIHLVKVKIGGGSSSGGSQRRATATPTVAAAASDAAAAGSSSRASRTSRRRSTLDGKSNSSSDTTGDIVPYGAEAANEALKLKDQQMRLLQEQLDALKMNATLGLNGGFSGLQQQQQQQQQQQHAFSQQQQASAFSQPSMFGNGGSLYALPPQQQQQSFVSMANSRPLDTLLTELHAKVDYLIRIAPAPGTGSNSSAGAGATDVLAVIRGVERLASENDRLMVQINAQTQQYVAYEKRCDELLTQNRQLAADKRRSDEKYQALASQQLSVSAEVASLTSARDAAITQTNRLHAEYQQLLAAYYEKQQPASANDEQTQALAFERDARARIERELAKEAQTRVLAEQELQLAKKQFAVTLQLKEAELTSRDEQQQVLATQRLAIQREELASRDAQLEATTRALQQQMANERDSAQQAIAQKVVELEAAQQEIETLATDKAALVAALESAKDRIAALESELKAASAVSATDATGETDATTNGSAVDETRLYKQQIALLQQQVTDLSTTSECATCASADAKEQAAERAVALAQQLKHETEAMLTARHATVDDSQTLAVANANRDNLTTLFKEAVNEMFFRFQDVFEDENADAGAAATVERKHVLAVIRKVLKQSTKDVLTRLQATAPSLPLPEPLPVGDSSGRDDSDSDGPPAPPPLESATLLAPASAADEHTTVESTAAVNGSEHDAIDDDEKEEEEDQRVASNASSHSASASVDGDDAGNAVDSDALFIESVSAQQQLPRGGVSGYVSTDDEFED